MGAIAPDRIRTRCGACLAAEDPWISTGHASFLGGALPWPCSRRSTREGGLHSARVSSRPQVSLSRPVSRRRMASAEDAENKAVDQVVAGGGIGTGKFTYIERARPRR